MGETSINPETFLTSQEVGELLQVNRRSVNNWIEQGRIEAFRTPGGHRRVRARDLLAFLTANQMPVPINLKGAGRRHIMIVDDDPHQLRSARRLFGQVREELEISTFDKAIDALVSLGVQAPDALLLDIYMPHIDGLEVCRRLRAHPTCVKTRIVACSGQLTPRVEAEALAAGADVCLHKPLSRAAVLGALGLSVK